MATQVVFFGSSEFSVVALEKLIDQVSMIITTPDKPVGRHLKLTPNPVKVFAQKHGLLVIESFEELIKNSVGLVAAYGKIIPQSVIDLFDGQIYNIHPSLLPKYRGPSPLQQQILDGITETGVTIIQLDALIDHGPIVTQIKDTILPDDTTQSLGNRLFAKGAELFLSQLRKARPCKAKNQNHSLASYTHKLTRQDGFVPWEQFRPENLTRQFLALHPWPGVWTLTPEQKRLKLISLPPHSLVQPENSPRPIPWASMAHQPGHRTGRAPIQQSPHLTP